jgi:hypothetical protein
MDWTALGKRMLNFLLFLCIAMAPLKAMAEVLPDAAVLQTRLKSQPQTVKVSEPHLYQGGKQVIRTYRGWPAVKVLDLLLGSNWRSPGVEIEFRALDGYVSRIPAERFLKFEAFLTFEHVGHRRFMVDNLQQNERNVPLGPYYLVWNNVRHPELLAEGGTYWPYQVKQILVSTAFKAALLPPDLPAGLSGAAAIAQKYCLSCHKVNGFGGDKWPGNLALQARKLHPDAFVRWVLEPHAVKPGTAMPGLPVTLPQVERELLAWKLHGYLTQVPITPEAAMK